MQAHNVQESSAMQNSLDKIQKRFVQNRTMCLGIVFLSTVTVVALAIALLAIVVTMQSGQTGFCTSDSCTVEKRSGYVDKEGREDWLNKLEIRMEQEQRQRRDELNRKVEEVMLQVKEYEAVERQERQQLQGQLSELQYKLDHGQKTKTRWEAKNLKRAHHLPFEFEIKDFTKYKENSGIWDSPPFYTNNGYKLCVRVVTQGTHVSVSAFLMAGVADNYLKWPFEQNITIKLMNQAGSWNPLSYFWMIEGKIGTFKFAREKHYRQRVAIGELALDGPQIPYFISQKKLDYNSKEGTQYLRNDKLKFRVSASSSYYSVSITLYICMYVCTHL